MRQLKFTLLALASLALLSVGVAQTTFTWTGAGGNNALETAGNWQGGVAPANNPGDDIVFTRYPAQHVSLNSTISIRNITFSGLQDGFWIDQGSGGVINLAGNVTTTSDSTYWGLFDRQVNLSAGSHTFTSNNADLYFWGGITGSGSIVKNGSHYLIIGAYDSQNPDTYSYSGGTTINAGVLAVGQNDALGTGTVTINGGSLSASQYAGSAAISLTNNFLFGSMTNFGGFGDSGTILQLGSNELGNTLAPVAGVTAVTFGQVQRQPVAMDGRLIDGVSGATRYTFSGEGTYTLSGDNSYTGGTQVNSGATVIFQGEDSLPATGLISAGSGSYVGLGDDSISAHDFLSHLDHTGAFAGTIGFDNAGTYSGPIDLSGFSNSSIAIGTSTSATLTGAIIPNSSSEGYLFQGTGWLHLADSVSANPLTGNNIVQVTSLPDRPPLMVVISTPGSNDYFGHTIVEGGGLIFDSLDAHSPNSTMELRSGGYLGITENSGISSLLPSVIGAGSHAADSVIGFDSHSAVNGNSSSGPTISNLDLSPISGSIYVGTASYATLAGTLTTTSGGGDSYYFTGYAGGTLTVNTALTGSRTVNVGLPGVFQDPDNYQAYSTVEISGANTYSGGTTLNSGYLRLLDPQAVNLQSLGSGALTVDATASDSSVAFEAQGTLLNNIVLQSGTLFVNSPNPLTLAGNISGAGLLQINNSNVTLGGTNNFSSGGLVLTTDDTVTIANDQGLKGATLSLSNGGNIQFTTAHPEISSIEYGNRGAGTPLLTLAASGTTQLTIDQLVDGRFDGAIVQSGSTGSIVKTGAGTLTLGTAGTFSGTGYTGGTKIQQGTLEVTSNNALGSGDVHLNGGTLSVQSGVTLSNPIVFDTNGGRLAGNGTFAASVAVGANAVLAPGASPGLLAFSNGLILSGGGAMDVEIQSAAGPAGTGYDSVAVTGGSLIVGASTGNKFTLRLISLQTNGSAGNVSDFNSGSSYSWLVFLGNSVGGITNFSDDKFTLDTSGFTNALGAGTFSLAQGTDSGNPALFLNFSPVPEPSTFVLIGAGLAGVVALRRRRR